MASLYTLHGWHLSYYTGKVLAYLRYKGLPFRGPEVNAWTLMRHIPQRFGAAVMPVLVTPEGEWIQDSSDIIDRLEQRHPSPSIHPQDPVLRFASYLMEAWGDEWWVPIAMHSRWNYPENYPLFEHDAGTQLLPGWPAFMQRALVRRVANTLRGMLPAVGVRAAQNATLERWTLTLLDQLDTHFRAQPFLFGNAPALGDFGLVATMYGHLGRDPWPAREWIAPRPHLRAWIDRMVQPADQRPKVSAPVQWQMADTLKPVFTTVFAEFTTWVHQIDALNRQAAPGLTPGRFLRRVMDDVTISTAAGPIQRAATPFTVWMAQRALAVYHAMPAADQSRVRAWAQALGGEAFLALDLMPLQRRGLRVRPMVPTNGSERS
jgi:glutathione S-transferase